MSRQPPLQNPTILKRDAFSETQAGTLNGTPVTLRHLDHVSAHLKPLARRLLHREARALRATQRIPGCPDLIQAETDRLLRHWIPGTPLHLARPTDPAWYHDAKRLLRDMRRAGVTHNDLAKSQNWLVTPDGRAAIIDFQLARIHRKRGALFRLMAREDLRHLLKHKRCYAPHLLTPSERRLLSRKSWPATLWMATGKPIYNLITRRLMNWSDGEGAAHRITLNTRTLRAHWQANPRISGMAFCSYARAGKTEGLYAFVETVMDKDTLTSITPLPGPDLLQIVQQLPRHADGTIRQDILNRIAANTLDTLEPLLENDTELSDITRPIINARLNLSDRKSG